MKKIFTSLFVRSATSQQASTSRVPLPQKKKCSFETEEIVTKEKELLESLFMLRRCKEIDEYFNSIFNPKHFINAILRSTQPGAVKPDYHQVFNHKFSRNRNASPVWDDALVQAFTYVYHCSAFDIAKGTPSKFTSQSLPIEESFKEAMDDVLPSSSTIRKRINAILLKGERPEIIFLTWEAKRLIFIGNKDKASPLSLLPKELLRVLIRHTEYTGKSLPPYVEKKKVIETPLEKQQRRLLTLFPEFIQQ
jgi:hypothetical protein